MFLVNHRSALPSLQESTLQFFHPGHLIFLSAKLSPGGHAPQLCVLCGALSRVIPITPERTKPVQKLLADRTIEKRKRNAREWKRNASNAARSKIIIPDVMTFQKSQRIRSQVRSETTQQPPIIGDACACCSPGAHRKWCPCFRIKAKEHVMCGKGQGSKPGDSCYKWSNNYVAAAGFKL